VKAGKGGGRRGEGGSQEDRELLLPLIVPAKERKRERESERAREYDRERESASWSNKEILCMCV